MGSIGEVVRRVRKIRNLRQRDVTDGMDGYDTGNLSRFERGAQHISELKLRQIAVILEVPLSVLYALAEYEHDFSALEFEQLLKSEEKNYTPEFLKGGVETHRRLPLISWVQAGTWVEMPSDVSHVEEWWDTAALVGERAFALRVRGDSMVNPYGAPSIPEGSVVIVDPDTAPLNGSIIVAALDETNEATLKKLVIDGPNTYLKPLNPSYRAIEVDKACRVLGVVKRVEADI